MTPILWWIVGIFAFANIGALLFAFLRFRASGDLPEAIPQRIESPADGLRVSETHRLRELEDNFQRIERAFNDLHTTVETRHRSLSGLVSKKLGRAAPPVDDDDEPITPPKSAFEKLAELEAQHSPPPPPQNSTRRHLRRF